jgi:DNA-binding NarL/FixJ family response regulator
MLRKGAPLEIVGETDKAARAVELSRERHPDVVLMDVTTRDLPGAEATRRIKKIDPNIQVLIVSLNDDKTLTSRCLAEGAAGCVPVNAHSVELKSAINTVWRRRPHAA